MPYFGESRQPLPHYIPFHLSYATISTYELIGDQSMRPLPSLPSFGALLRMLIHSSKFCIELCRADRHTFRHYTFRNTFAHTHALRRTWHGKYTQFKGHRRHNSLNSSKRAGAGIKVHLSCPSAFEDLLSWLQKGPQARGRTVRLVCHAC